MDATSRSFAPSALVPSLLILICFLVAATIFRTEVPILIDYPNHLARFWLLLGGARLPSLAPFYVVDWGQSILVGIDVLALFLGQFLPYTIAGKVIAFLALAGPPAGAACLSRAVFGRWHWWHLSFPLLTWSTTALYGLLAFQISIAFALAFSCIDLRLPTRRGVKIVLRILFGSLVLFFHPFGLGFYLLTLFAIIIGPDWRSLAERSRQLQITRDAVLAVPTLVVPVICLLLFAPTLPRWHSKTTAIISWPFGLHYQIYSVLSPFWAYKPGVDLLFFAPLLAILGYALYTKRIQTYAGLVIVAFFLGILSVVSPQVVGDEPSFSLRFPIMAALLLFAGVLPEPLAERTVRIVAAAGVFALAFARLAYIDHVWQLRQSDVRSLESALSHVPPGAKVFALRPATADLRSGGSLFHRLFVFDSRPWRGDLRHMPTLAIPQRQAFVPSLFATPGQQPVRFLPPWDALENNMYEVPDVHVIEKALSPQDSDSYLRDWDKRFDYVLLIEMNHENLKRPLDLPGTLQLVSDDGYAQLYRIVR
jgi:hypothetical protein